MGSLSGPYGRPSDKAGQAAWSKTCWDWQNQASLLHEVHPVGGRIGGQRVLQDGADLQGDGSGDRRKDPRNESGVSAALEGGVPGGSPH